MLSVIKHYCSERGQTILIADQRLMGSPPSGVSTIAVSFYDDNFMDEIYLKRHKTLLW